MPRIIAISITKGGVGKTTTAVNLSAGLAEAGRRVLLVDTDTQAQASRALGVNPEVGLAEVLNDEVPAAMAPVEVRKNLQILAGGQKLANIKRGIAQMEMRSEAVLADTLNHVNDLYDYIILDTSPGWDTMQVNVLVYATEVLAPVLLEGLAVHGLGGFMQKVMKIQAHHDLDLRYILPTFLDRRTKQSAEILKQLESNFDNVCDPIRYNVRLSEAATRGKTIFEYDSRSAGAEDYKKLTERVLEDE